MFATLTAAPVTRDTELIFRRVLDTFPDPVLIAPVVFAFVVLFLVVFYRQSESIGSLLKTLLIPPAVITVLSVVWGLWLLAFGITVIATALNGVVLSPTFYIWGGAPLVIYPVLLGVLGMIVLCIRNPRVLVPLVMVTLLSGVYLGLGYVFKPTFSWWVILVPVLLLAFFYVAMMYRQDAKTIHPAWATFLAFLRVTVYAILGFVFLLPGCQTFDTRETHSKVLVLFDVSDSMRNVDDVAKPGEDPKKLPNRLDKIVAFLDKANAIDGEEGTKANFLQHVQMKSPVTAYRFGALLDDYDADVLQLLGNTNYSGEQWQAWLNPDKMKVEVPDKIGDKELDEDEKKALELKLYQLYEDLRSGTNISGAALQAAVRESNNLIQAIIIFSDGQSNLGSDDTFRELMQRAKNPKRPIHVITVGVGKFRQPVSINVGNILAPQLARPDDKFPVRVPVTSIGLVDKPFTVNLDVRRVEKRDGKWVELQKVTTLTKSGTFTAVGEQALGEVEFEIDVNELAGVKKGDESQDSKVEGYWEFTARVPRHPDESFTDKEHVSPRPARVLVQKRKLRVLLFAGGPTREYQFLRTMLYREVMEKRVEMSIFLQTGLEDNVDQDVEKERLLTQFPNRLGVATKDPYMSLDSYDVIIAFDPDWSLLTPDQLKLIKEWVGGADAGGLIFIAGPVNSHQLARPAGLDLSAIMTLIPVKLKDARLHGLGIGHDSTRPYVLNIDPSAVGYDFMKLTEDSNEAFKGWKDFFWDGEAPPAGKDAVPARGFFNYYPVEKVKPGAKVLATFAGPPSSRIEDGAQEQPFIVTMDYGSGKTIYISSGELWRLRQFDEDYHQRLWVKMARYAGSGRLGKVDQHGMILMVHRAPTGRVNLEAQVLGADHRPLPRDARPEVLVKRPANFDKEKDKNTPEKFEIQAKSKEGDWNGWFSGSFTVFTPGDYTLRIPIAGTGKFLEHDITIYRPDPETDNTRPNFGHLYQLATSATPMLARLEEKKRDKLKDILKPPTAEPGQEEIVLEDGSDPIRLYFPLEQAYLIPELLIRVPPNLESTKGAFQDLWAEGWRGSSVSMFWILLTVAGAIGLLAAAIFISGLTSQEWFQAIVSGIIFGLCLLVIIGTIIADLSMRGTDTVWNEVPLQASGYHLLLWIPTIVGLLITAILVTIRQFLAAVILFVCTLLFALGVFAYGVAFPDTPWAIFPLEMSYVLAAVVGLLCLEWLTRKLLRLA